MTRTRRLGLIVNPIAGMGGSVGLKGTDTPTILREARARGATPQAPARAEAVLRILAESNASIALLSVPGAMGADPAGAAGFPVETIGGSCGDETGAADTRRAAAAMADAGVALILFAGGDGTARDIAAAVGDRVPVVGVPAGVKMHSAVYATSPRAAAHLVLRALDGALETREREVMDIDEAAFRAGAVSATLYGYLRVPYAPDLVQNVKTGGVSGDHAALAAAAAEVASRLAPDRIAILGPGTTMRAVATALGVEKTLLGVDLVRGGALLAADAGEADILAALEAAPGSIVVTPIGGQGHFIGRGNQQISPGVIARVGTDNIIVVATPEKIASLRDNTLHVDSGDPALDAALVGWRRVITGFGSETVCRVAT